MEVKAAIIHYCRYQERCHSEVRNKLYELGCTTPEVEDMLTGLIETGLLSEERFAIAYARGKFRMKQWGKVKIKQQLKLRKISDYCIRKALAGIDPGEYEITLSRLATEKAAGLKKHKNVIYRKAGLYRYLIQKGYESDLVTNIVNELNKKASK